MRFTQSLITTGVLSMFVMYHDMFLPLLYTGTSERLQGAFLIRHTHIHMNENGFASIPHRNIRDSRTTNLPTSRYLSQPILPYSPNICPPSSKQQPQQTANSLYHHHNQFFLFHVHMHMHVHAHTYTRMTVVFF